MEPERVTASFIRGLGNQEVFRILVRRYGIERYLDDIAARKIHEDKWGQLYRAKGLVDREDEVFVKVVNATPEHDGSTKEYFLRVPPDVATAHEAVAWTFNLSSKQYRPKIQT